MRPSSYHQRNRYMNKPVIIKPSESLLPRARLINTSTPSILRPTIRNNSIPYYPSATIIHSKNNRSSYHRNRRINNHYNNHHRHHRNNNSNYSYRNGVRRNRRTIDRNRRSVVDKSRGRSRSRNRDKFNDKKAKQSDISGCDRVIESRNEFGNKYQESLNKYYQQIVVSKLNNYYNNKLTPRFMMENDDTFRNRLEQIKGLNVYQNNAYFEGIFDDDKNRIKSNKKSKHKNDKNKKKTENKSRTKTKTKNTDKNIFNSRGKSSMNYKFRAFKKSNQPNSFVDTEEKVGIDINTKKNRYHHHHHHHHNHGNIHVNDDDIYIDREDHIDMNELINGLVYSFEYQDHRIGTLNTAQNDYSQYFVDTRKRPQNFIRELAHIDRLKEYPKLRKLMQSKNESLRKCSVQTPPFYINTDLKRFDLLSLQCKFDVILVDPPWRFYADRCPGAKQNVSRTPWSFEEMSDLRIQDIAENPSFLFLWSGSGETLNDGRLLLKKWGYKRCEVIVWLKTNKKNQIKLSGDKLNEYLLEKNDNYSVQNEYEGKNYNDSLFVRSYEHCLMGIRGQVRRSTDGHLIHANVDTDVIITESAPYGSSMKPNELYDIIERFCMGRKRLELFGSQHNLRPGWLTISNDDIPNNSNYDAMYYNSLFMPPNPRYVPSTNEIEALRPKSPIRNNQKNKKNVMAMNNMNNANNVSNLTPKQ